MVTDLNKTSTVGTLSHLIDITLHTCTQSVNIQRPLQKKSCFFHLSARRYYSREQGGQGIFVDNLCVMFCGIAHIGKVSISTLDMQISNKLQETPGEETMNHIAVRTELHIQFTKQHYVTYLRVIIIKSITTYLTLLLCQCNNTSVHPTSRREKAIIKLANAS